MSCYYTRINGTCKFDKKLGGRFGLSETKLSHSSLINAAPRSAHFHMLPDIYTLINPIITVITIILPLCVPSGHLFLKIRTAFERFVTDFAHMSFSTTAAALTVRLSILGKQRARSVMTLSAKSFSIISESHCTSLMFHPHSRLV